MIINHVDITQTNGLIVALDQEKAYNKICHDYLWRVLEACQIPDQFIRTVKFLYENAHTRVMVNGFLSLLFRVTRGVRQGDPLSCLLFDIAIEPLAEMLRKSSLKGLEVPSSTEHLIAKLFADDTTTFLHEDNDVASLMNILDVWCLASGAKFNIVKTQIIPIGQKSFHQKVSNERRTNDEFNPISNDIKIVEDGEAIHILGAWFGNEIPIDTAWTQIIEKVNRNLNHCEMSHPLVPNCRIIIQTVIGGLTQYLSMAQGMPKHIEDLLEKRE